MSQRYDHLDRDALIRILERRDSERQLGLVWERPEAEGGELEADASVNSDFVALELDPALSHGDGPWRDLIIEGDNYDALRYLRMTHAGRIRCIYIDPPYNTGKRDFVYNDRFVDPANRFRHSLWLEFMHRRLVLARDLLAEDGVIFVSIDDNELFRLGMLMDQVFGEMGFIANVIWQKVYSPKNTAQHFSDDHEYLLVYAKDPSRWRPNPVPRNESQTKAYKNPDNDPRGVWKPGDLSARNYYGAGTYAITSPSGRVISSPPAGMYWRVSKEKLQQLDSDGRIWWGKDGNNVPAIKRFLSEVRTGVVPQTLWKYDEVGHTQDAKKQLLDVLTFDRSEDVFSTPKPVQLMERILQIATKPNDVTLDFFAGSGTLAEALVKLNMQDGGNRGYILVSNTEATDEQPDKNLCRDVCAERVRRVLGGYRNAKGEPVAGLGGGFAYLRTRRVPRHRINRRLGHVEIWHALCLMNRHPVARWDGRDFVGVGEPGSHEAPLAYLPALDEPCIAQLHDWLRGLAGTQAQVYCWAPERLAGLDPAAATVLPIPQTLADRFGR